MQGRVCVLEFEDNLASSEHLGDSLLLTPCDCLVGVLNSQRMTDELKERCLPSATRSDHNVQPGFQSYIQASEEAAVDSHT